MKTQLSYDAPVHAAVLARSLVCLLVPFVVCRLLSWGRIFADEQKSNRTCAFLNCMLALATGVAPEEVEAWDHELSGERPGCMPEWTGVATGADSSARYTT
jgi:hypothetical protein